MAHLPVAWATPTPPMRRPTAWTEPRPAALAIVRQEKLARSSR